MSNLELVSHKVAGYDGPSGSIFMAYGGGTATADDGWTVDFASDISGSTLIGYVKDSSGKHVATYSLEAKAFSAEALRLGREKVAQREVENIPEKEA